LSINGGKQRCRSRYQDCHVGTPRQKSSKRNTRTAAIFSKQGKYPEAVAAFQEVLKYNPNDPATHFSLGATYQAMKNFDGAIKDIRSQSI